jgi:hypothetical protein
MLVASGDRRHDFTTPCFGRPAPVIYMACKMSSWDLLGIDAYAEDDLGYAPS